jgi:hypothetical protein
MRSQVYLLIFCLLKYEFTSPWNNKHQWTSGSQRSDIVVKGA